MRSRVTTAPSNSRHFHHITDWRGYHSNKKDVPKDATNKSPLYHRCIQNRQNVLHRCLRLRYDIRLQIVHIGFGQISQGADSQELPIFRNNWLCLCLIVSHQFPCSSHRCFCGNTLYRSDIYILHLGKNVLTDSWRSRIELFKHERSLSVEFTCTACLKSRTPQCSFAHSFS